MGALAFRPHRFARGTALTASGYAPRATAPTIAALLIGLVGLVAGLALPFAPVLAEQAELIWPAPGAPAESTTAILVPYRPAELSATVPCAALRAAAARDVPTTVLATGGSTDANAGLLVRVSDGRSAVLVNSRLVAQAPVGGTDCSVRVDGAPNGVRATTAGGTVELPGAPVPEVAVLRTDLTPAEAAGLTVRTRTVNPFDTVPSGLKIALLVVQLLAAAAALALLLRDPRGLGPRTDLNPGSGLRPRPDLGPGSGTAPPPGPGPRRGAHLHRIGRPTLRDAGVVAVLAGWAVIGPLSDDDGFVTMIARNSLVSGDAGNYYRWWNASEAPFTLAQQVVAVLAQVSLQPLWLRLPSTLMGVAAWLVLDRAVLPRSLGPRARLLAAAAFLVAWLPYNLGVRPEPYVALGGVLVLALLVRGRGPAALGAAVLVTAVTMTASPSGVLVLAGVPVFARRIGTMLRAGSGISTAARLALLGAVGAVALSLVFADQSLHGLITATRWHAEFSPSQPWHQEVQRYGYLLGGYQDGNALKRVPVLLTLALLPVVALLRGTPEDTGLHRDARRLAGCVATGFALLWSTPSKWTLYFGSLAPLFGAFLAVSAVLLVRRARTGRFSTRVALLAGGLVAFAAGLSFAGTNDWWQPVLYALPWAGGPIRPAGLPLDLPPLWAGAALVAVGAVWRVKGRAAGRRALLTAPALLVAAALGTALTVLLGSFVSAPLRRPEASLARANLHLLAGGSGCGPADSIEVMPDVPGGVLTPAAPGPAAGGVPTPDGDELDGWTANAGWRPDRPPPDPPGVRASGQVWGSRVDGDPTRTGRLTSRWFSLPPLAAGQELALTVSGRADRGNRLTFEFGTGSSTATVGAGSLTRRIPHDPPRTGAGRRKPTDPSIWRSVWLARDEVPAGADRVRVLAVDGTADPDGWLAVTGPRLRRVVPLVDYLRDQRPVLVNWPIAFLFPCVRDVVSVAHGVAAAPRAVLAPAARYDGLAGQSTDPGVAGVFSAAYLMGGLGEVPSRVVGHPELDWGSLRLAGYGGATRDRYQLELTRYRQSGTAGDVAQIITESNRADPDGGR